MLTQSHSFILRLPDSLQNIWVDSSINILSIRFIVSTLPKLCRIYITNITGNSNDEWENKIRQITNIEKVVVKKNWSNMIMIDCSNKENPKLTGFNSNNVRKKEHNDPLRLCDKSNKKRKRESPNNFVEKLRDVLDNDQKVRCVALLNNPLIEKERRNGIFKTDYTFVKNGKTQVKDVIVITSRDGNNTVFTSLSGFANLGKGNNKTRVNGWNVCQCFNSERNTWIPMKGLRTR